MTNPGLESCLKIFAIQLGKSCSSVSPMTSNILFLPLGKKRRAGERGLFTTYVKTTMTAKKLEIVLKHHLRALSGWEPKVQLQLWAL